MLLRMNLKSMNEKHRPASTDKIYLEHAREQEQLKDMEDIANRDICFMCPEHIPEFYEERDGLIAEGDHSYLVHNGYPYEGTSHHLMVLPKEHVTTLGELSDDFVLEAFSFLRTMEEELEVEGGAIAMRFGEPALTGATVHHLHLHLIVPKTDLGPNDEPVRFRMSRKFTDQNSA